MTRISFLPLVLLKLSLVLSVQSLLAHRVPSDHSPPPFSLADLVAKTTPTVVNIYATRKVRERASPLFADPFFRHFFGDRFDFGLPRERVENSLGSGVIVDKRGLLVTNNHVIANADEIRAVLSDRREFPAKLLLADERTDLAVLSLESQSQDSFPALPFADSDTLAVGDSVIAIGNPFSIGQTVTRGIISALARTDVGITDYSFFIQTDAAINPGNSGGALVTMRGELAGINTAIYSKSGTSAGIGFAIPANMVRTVVQAAQSGGKIQRPWIGLTARDIGRDIAQALNLKDYRGGGALVESLWPGGPAESAGIQPGDLILEVDHHAIDGERSLRYRIATAPINDVLRLTIRRKLRNISIALKPIAPPEDPPRQMKSIKGQNPLAGASVVNFSPAVAESLSINMHIRKEGVIVEKVERGSPAARLGVQPGDWLIEINGQSVKRTRDLDRTLKRAARGWNILLKRRHQSLVIRTP